MLNQKKLMEILEAMDADAARDPEPTLALHRELMGIREIQMGIMHVGIVLGPTVGLVTVFGLGFQLGQRYAQVEQLDQYERLEQK